jgi:L-asparaginase II
MSNPVLVEVVRGTLTESRHRGAVAVVDADGATVLALGDVAQPVYPRSAVKPLQALALVEGGAADRYGFGDQELALACASHGGEPPHVEVASRMLARAGLAATALECGAHWPSHLESGRALARGGGAPSSLHNNCSGKHAGFLTVARHWDIATNGYEQPNHPVQRAVATTLSELCDAGELSFGIDGCAAPNFATSLTQFARAAARMAAPEKLAGKRAAAARRIVAAMIAHPELISGTARVCAILMRACGGRAAVKAGAEGYYAGWIPGAGFGIAIKIDDGAGRAAETVIAALLDSLKLLDDSEAARTILRAPILNTRGAVVGERRPSPALADLRLV